jgi:CO dehydrogenase/acetyl-CoA synthase gamma subunit (corrinoid Fe-S protein)
MNPGERGAKWAHLVDKVADYQDVGAICRTEFVIRPEDLTEAVMLAGEHPISDGCTMTDLMEHVGVDALRVLAGAPGTPEELAEATAKVVMMVRTAIRKEVEAELRYAVMDELEMRDIEREKGVA